MPTGDMTPALERYLETIYYLDAEGETVRPSRIAEWLGVSQPTISAAIHRLVKARLVSQAASKALVFTPKGRKEAARVVRRHRIVERWLTDELGFDWLEADVEAGSVEHAVSDRVAERLYERLGRPATCPHGNPIPGATAPPRSERPLSALRPGERSRMVRVSEATEHEAPTLLRFLSDHGFALDANLELVSVDEGSGALTVAVEGTPVAMSIAMADKVWVG